ncbi:MAG: hypothetical protein QOJ13_1257 [Gaiellales bacterium]|jgi:hypothetical protein|nr:hypothetical protein [Gaiellales bacterium]
MLDGVSPSVELLWWDGCPSLDRALGDLRAAMTAAGLDPERIALREVTTDEDAQRKAFAGSPTILINGLDPFAEDDVVVGLNCRVYRRSDGRLSPTPDPAELRRALEQAVAA